MLNSERLMQQAIESTGLADWWAQHPELEHPRRRTTTTTPATSLPLLPTSNTA